MERKVVIVTGGTRGLGFGMVRQLAKENYFVYFNYIKNVEKAERMVAEFGRDNVAAFQCDVSKMSQVKEMVQRILVEQQDRIDVLINNAGITQDQNLLLMGDEEWHTVIDTNLNGVYNCSRAVVFSMLKRRSGVILNVSSISGVIGMPGQTNYSSAKAGVLGFTKALAKEVSAKGIRVNAIAPGCIETDMTQKLQEGNLSELKKRILLGRLGTVEEVAHVVSFLISDAASYITGQVIHVDGGLAT